MPNAPNAASILTVALIAYPGAMVSALHGFSDVLEVANRYADDLEHRFAPAIVDRDRALPAAPLAAVVFPPTLSGARPEPDDGLAEWLLDQQSRGAILCSACAGAFWLAGAGLLDGRPATTHWALEGEFRRAFPRVDLQSERMVVDDGDIVTAGGVMAWTDLALILIHRFLGPATVTRTARHLLIDPQGREQIHYRSFRPLLDHGDARILAVQRLIERDVRADLSAERLAAAAGLTLRTFQRRFHAATGLSPLAYVQRVRIERARGLLERTRESVGQICWAVGYEDPSAFMRLFKSTTGLTAAEYRRRFQVG